MCGETAAALLSCVLCLNARALILIHRTFMCILHTFSCTTVSRCSRRACTAGSASGEVEPRRTRPLRPVHRISGKHCIALFERDLCASEALGLYMLSARADAFTTGAWHPRSDVKLAAAPQHPPALWRAHDNCLPNRRARCAHVAPHSSRPAQRRRRRTCEEGPCMRWYGIGDRACV